MQHGDTPAIATGFGEGVAGVLKLVEDHDGQTFRAAYTDAFPEAIYVLHAFEKKSTHGIATPKREIALIRQRLRWAREHYHATYPPDINAP